MQNRLIDSTVDIRSSTTYTVMLWKKNLYLLARFQNLAASLFTQGMHLATVMLLWVLGSDKSVIANITCETALS